MTETAPRTNVHHNPEHPRCESSGGKIGYPTWHRAQRELKACLEARRDGKPYRLERRVYQCPGCQQWHLSSRPYAPLDAEDLEPLVAKLRARFGK